MKRSNELNRSSSRTFEEIVEDTTTSINNNFEIMEEEEMINQTVETGLNFIEEVASMDTTVKQPPVASMDTTVKQAPVVPKMSAEDGLFNSYIKYTQKAIIKKEEEVKLLKEKASKTAVDKQKIYKIGRDLKLLNIFSHLMNRATGNSFVGALTEFDLDFFESFIGFDIKSSKKAPKITVVVEEGDKILDLLEKYETVTNISKKLKDAASKKGLYLDYTSGTVRTINPSL